MIDLSQLRKGRAGSPPRMVIYGPHGIGKSTFANQARAVFIPTESGLDHIDLVSGAFPKAECVQDVYDAIGVLATQEHSYTAVALDTIDWFEKLIFTEVCNREGVASIEKVGGGWGKGYVEALDEWYRLFEALDYLREQRKMAVILLAHCRITNYANPMGEPFDRYQLDLHASKSISSAAKVMEWSDLVGFVNYRTITKKNDVDAKRVDGKSRGIGTGERILYLEERPAFQAKNRFSLQAEMPFSWDELSKHLNH